MKRVWLLAGVALVALGSPAFAQQATGLYVSAGIGANFEQESDGTWSDGASDDVTSDVGPVGVVAVGYDWGLVRTEVELGVRSNDLADETYDGNEHYDATGHDRVISAMANVLVDFDLGAFSVYGGGGLGVANLERYYRDDGVTFFDETLFDTQIAYQGIAGVAFNLSPQLAVTGEYRYFSTFERFDFGNDTASYSDASYSAHSGLIGIRYTFAPPAPAAAEIVQAKSYLVFFDFDSSKLTADAQSIVASAAADALAGGSPSLNVTGHTDRSGSDAYNQALSIRRATSVKDALVAGGVPAGIIVIRGAGESEPLVPTADGVREPQNRRVEIVIN